MKHVIPLAAVLAFACFVCPAWAAQPQAQTSVEEAFEQLKAYEYGQNRRPLAMLELAIVRATADPKQGRKMAARLAAVLTDAKATLAAKRFACQQLQILGAETHVPLLAGMLDTAETADMARRTLETIPGKAAAEALRAALARLKGRPLVGVINSLGVRRDAKVTDALAKLLRSSNSDVAAAAAVTLGKIGTADAAAALRKAQAGAGAKQLAVVRDAALRCAEHLAADGKAADAEAIYRRLWQSKAGVSWRLAALTGLARACPDKAAPLLVEAFGGKDPLLQAAAANLLVRTPGKAATTAIVEQLSRVDARRRVLLLDSLAARGDASAKDAVAKFIDSKDEAVRVAAVHTVAALGDASDVARLVALAAGERGPVGQAARVGLERLSGKGIEKRLIDLTAKGDPTTRVEAARAIAARRTPGAMPALLQAAADKNESVRLAALDALATVGGTAVYPKLIDLMMGPSTEEVWEAMLRAVSAIGKRIADPEKRVRPVVEALLRSPDPVKVGLLRVLAGFGGREALDAVRRSLKSGEARVRDAAVRALASWTDASAAEDLLNVAKDSDSATHRNLALRGYLRLARAAKDKAARLKMLEQVRPVATTAQAKKMLLAALADVPDPAALEMAKSFLDDSQVKAEAELAVRKITGAMKPKRAGGKPQPNSSPPMPQVKPSAKTGKAGTRILIITGIDYPGHKWRQTTPVLKEAIEKDPRLAVDVVEDPNFLASPGLHDYAAIVHHWMNWKAPAPGPAARENFRKFVAGGKGLVIVHFGCGAFQDWPEFVKIAGRVWDPKLRSHDPRGPFRVEIADTDHPITRGMKPFETHDELYTCLAGDVPIHVLATARSKVDKKVYPMAFVLTCGKGRVFHSVLGHDVKALANPPVGELFRRATAWAAGLPPAPGEQQVTPASGTIAR